MANEAYGYSKEWDMAGTEHAQCQAAWEVRCANAKLQGRGCEPQCAIQRDGMSLSKLGRKISCPGAVEYAVDKV